MDYRRKPLASYNQLPHQKIKKRDAFAKNVDYPYIKNINIKNNENVEKTKLENNLSEVNNN